PQTVASFATNRGLSLETRKSTPGGATLEQHWIGKKGSAKINSRRQIESGEFDAVVLQEQSLRPIENPDKMMEYALKLSDSVQQKGGQIFLYMTWSREATPETQNQLKESYEAVAKRTGATVAPVGLAWKLARERIPGISLYAADGSHPSRIGSYLAACVIYSTLTGQPCRGLRNVVMSNDQNGESILLTRISKTDAIFLHSVADEIMRIYRQPSRD
ncbi:MAG: hypothetical protein ACI92G_004410, partial [Candidatus Pelagisphaera sp.]